MGQAVLKSEVEERPNLRAQFVERITAAWHKSREKIFALGNALIEAKRALVHGEFEAMLQKDLPFHPDHARRFMRIAADPRLSNPASTPVLPETVEAMDTLRRLNDEQFETAIARGAIHPGMTVRDSIALVNDLTGGPKGVHRPGYANITAPSAPGGNMSSSSSPESVPARTYSELVWQLARRREMLGFSQLELDARVGWPEGMTSKLEIPHQPDGRVAGANNLSEWLSGLGVGLQIVPLGATSAGWKRERIAG